MKSKFIAGCFTALVIFCTSLTTANAFGQPELTKDRLWQRTTYLDSADYGIYEIASDIKNNRVYAAVIDKIHKADNLGFVNVYNAQTLAPLASYKMPYRAFSLTIDTAKQMLYVGHTQELKISRVDANSGKVLATSEKMHFDAQTLHENLRHMVYDAANNNLFVGYLTAHQADAKTPPETILRLFVLDGTTLKVKGEVKNAYPSRGFGLYFDKVNNKIYTSGIFINEINPNTLKVERQLDLRHIKPTTMGINSLVVDKASNRIFGAQFSTIGLTAEGKDTDGVYVFALDSGKLIKYIRTGEGVQNIQFSPKHKELYVTNFKSGTISVLDSTDYHLKQLYRAAYFPNMMALAEDESQLYVGVKEGFNKIWNQEEFVEGAKERILKFTLNKDLKPDN